MRYKVTLLLNSSSAAPDNTTALIYRVDWLAPVSWKYGMTVFF